MAQFEDYFNTEPMSRPEDQFFTAKDAFPQNQSPAPQAPIPQAPQTPAQTLDAMLAAPQMQTGGQISGLYRDPQMQTIPVQPVNRAAEQEQVVGQFGGGAEAERLYREAEQQATVRSVGERAGARAQIKALRARGMDEERIKDEINKTLPGGQTLSDLSSGEAFSSLNRLRMREERRSIADKKASRISDNINNKARWDTDEEGNKIAGNKYAKAVELTDVADDVGTDPDETKTVYDYMTKGEKAQYDRHLSDVSNRGGTNQQQRRAEKNLEKARKRQETASAGRELGREKKIVDQRIDEANERIRQWEVENTARTEKEARSQKVAERKYRDSVKAAKTKAEIDAANDKFSQEMRRAELALSTRRTKAAESNSKAQAFNQEYDRKQDKYERADKKVITLERSGRPLNKAAGDAYDRRLEPALSDRQKASDAIDTFLEDNADTTDKVVEIERQTADGKTAIYDSVSKEFIRYK